MMKLFQKLIREIKTLKKLAKYGIKTKKVYKIR